jgi:hypothetical protein
MVSELTLEGPSFWWVNQRFTFAAEQAEGIMWAPKFGQNGHSQFHWETMRQVQPGDRIIHYVDGIIMATSVAATSAFDSRRPLSLGADRWDEEGRMVRVNYTLLEQPIGLDKIDPARRIGSPFTIAHTVRQGYLFPIDSSVVEYLTTTFDRLTWEVPYAARYVPSEARQDASELLRQLVRRPLTTASGRPNVILEVRPDNVLVATDRSPAGTVIPIKWIAEALERLRDEGTLTISVEEVGHRSAFVGAVLHELPGARFVGSPPTITFEPDDSEHEPNEPNESDNPSTATSFVGALNKDTTTLARGEQSRLRRALLGSVASASCAICDAAYPVRFLRAAHIKKRASCTEEEARDLSHIAMVACLFGCDALYEEGVISVDEAGRVIGSPTLPELPGGSPLVERVAALLGRPVSAFTNGSKKYFEWHRSNTYLR